MMPVASQAVVVSVVADQAVAAHGGWRHLRTVKVTAEGPDTEVSWLCKPEDAPAIDARVLVSVVVALGASGPPDPEPDEEPF